MAGLLERHAADAGLEVAITSTGFIEAGLPPTERTVKLLGRVGVDVAQHRSSRLGSGAPPVTDFVLTAERAHVVSIASRWPELFDRAFTLPEAVERGEEVGPRGDRDVHDWIAALAGGRPSRLAYIDDIGVGQVADPTGGSPAEWRRSFGIIDELTKQLVTLLA